MARETLDQSFARFRRTGDPAALAAVFDRSAAELLHLASHLARDRHQAEDLLQATFVVAIEHAAALGEGAPVLPWLIAILANRARRLQRERRRVPDPERLPQRSEPGPEAQASSAELSQALTAAIAQLSEPYRPVLTLHLQHGLSAHEIAAVLERPPGTVRTQIVRGLESVRRTLPVGFAVGALALGTPGRGLAAVRAAVLGHLPASAATTAVAPVLLSGALFMSAKTWVACCLLLLLPTLWFLWPTQGAPDAGAPGVVTDAGAAAPAAPRPALGPPAAATQRTSVAVVPDPAPTDSRHGELVVSVRWAEDQTPAAGIGVTVHPVAGRGLLDQEGTTDSDGVARLAAVAAGAVQVILDRAGTRDLEVLAGRSTRVELSLPVGMTVTGVVLDPHDQPVPQATIWLSREQIDDQGQAVGRSGADGRFAVRGVASERVVGARAPGWVPSRLARVQGTPGSRHELTLRLTQPGGAVHGRVLDALRRPIAGARVQVGDCLANGRAMALGPLGIVGAAPLLAWTGSDGAFAVDGVPGDAPPPGREVRVFAGAPGFAPWQGVARCTSGRATELDIVLTRGATVSGRVTDPFGRPLANVLVLAGDGALHTAQPTWMRGSMTTGSEGTFRFAGLPAGALEMYAQTRTGAATHDTVVVAEGGAARWDPILGGGRRILGRVVDERGAPLARWNVGSGPSGGLAGRIDPTDREGRFTITDCAAGPHRLEVHEPGTRGLTPVVIRDGVEPDGEAIVLQVPDANRSTAYLTGTLLGADGQPAVRTLRFLRVDTLPLLECQSGAQGVFRFGPVPPARYRAWVNATATAPGTELGAHELAAGQTLDLGVIRLR